MKAKERYAIDIYRLTSGVHEYDFKIDGELFALFPDSLVKNADGNVHLTLDKRESLIQAALDFQVNIPLVCDRSLRDFSHVMNEQHQVLFKYGEEEQELDDDVYMITQNTQQIHFEQFLYEWILLAVPMKKVHPDLRDEEDSEEIIFRSGVEEKKEESDEVDPRWEQLKKLRNK